MITASPCTKMLHVRVLALACLLCLANGTRLSLMKPSLDNGLSPVKQREFDYFMFVRQWPGSFCSTHACPLVSDRGFHFTIHGLWPNYGDGTWPQFCDKNYSFDEDEIEDILGALEGEWPSVYDSDDTFWEHEWSKHGTCALSVFSSEHSYFKNILKLHWRYDLAAALRKSDIVPSKTQVYQTKELKDAIYNMYGVQPLVHCYGKQLSEIWMCFDKDMKPFNCDTSHETGGCQEVTIPPFKSEAVL